MKGEDFPAAYNCYDSAYEIAKNIHGRYHQSTAYLLLLCASAKSKDSAFAEAISLYEYAAKVYLKIDGPDSMQLYKIYLQLVTLFFTVGREAKADAAIQDLLSFVEGKVSEARATTLRAGVGGRVPGRERGRQRGAQAQPTRAGGRDVQGCARPREARAQVGACAVC